MTFLKLLNKLLGAIVFFGLAAPWIILAVATSCFLLFDALPRIRLNTLLSALSKPILVLLMGMMISFEEGWKMGIYQFVVSAPARIWHFLTKQIPFGLKDDEFVSGLFKTPKNPAGVDIVIPHGFFGRIVKKFLSLTKPMNDYVSYASGNARPQNDLNIYFTEKLLSQLGIKYYNSFYLPLTLHLIKVFLKNKERTIQRKLTAARLQPESTAAIQAAQFELEQASAALRCVLRLEETQETAPDIRRNFSTPSIVALCFVWQAIETEGHPNSQEGLKDKLMLTLYQIQRGFNIANGSSGADLPECPIGSLGLLVRVVVNEPERMPGNPYEAPDPSSANLTEALKASLNRPFATSYGDIQQSLDARKMANEYTDDPIEYKEKQKNLIRAYWKIEYRELIQNRVLDEKAMDDIVNAGVEAWEPPALQMRR